MKRLRSLIAIFTITMFSTLYAYSIDTDRLGSDYRFIYTKYPQECAIACYTESRCKAYTHLHYRNKCFLKNSIPQESYKVGCTSGLSNVTFTELQQIVAANGTNIRFKRGKSRFNDITIESKSLELLAIAIKKNAHSRLYISVKRKTGGLAKRRVNYLKSILSRLGLPPSKYHVQRVSKADKNRAWLSKNNQIWIRVEQTR